MQIIDRSFQNVQSVARAFSILEYLDSEGRGFRLGEIASHVKINKSTTHRFLVTLCNLGYVSQDPDTKYYKITPQLSQLGRSALDDFSLVSLAKPYLNNLSKNTAETINLGILDGNEVYYVDKRDSPHPFRLCVEVGGRAPVHATALGKVLLAFLPENEIQTMRRNYPFEKYTDATITSWSNLEHELQRIRHEGVGYDNGEMFTGLKCIAGPIFQHQRIIASVSISVPATRGDDRRFSYFKDLLIDATQQLSDQLDRY